MNLCMYECFVLLFFWLVIQTGGAVVKHGNGTMRERELSLLKKRRQSENSDDEDEDSYNGRRITEERYRSMLGEHIQKYKRRVKDSSGSPAPTRMGIPVPKSNLGLKARKLGNEHQGGFQEVETMPDWFNDINPQKHGIHREADFAPLNGSERFVSFFGCFTSFLFFGNIHYFLFE